MGDSYVSEELHRAILGLREQGVSTPEICQMLTLDVDTVIEQLLLQPVPVVPKQAPLVPKRSVGRPKKWEVSGVMTRIAQVLSRRDACEGFPLWTLSDLIRALRNSPYPHLSEDTLRRYLSHEGLTFETQLQRITGGSVVPQVVSDLVSQRRSILYVVTHQIHRTIEEGISEVPTTLMTGVTSSNRIAIMGRPQGRLSEKMLLDYLRGLLALHPERQVVVIAKSEGVYRSIWPEFRPAQSQRLHYLLSKNG
jgi:hypothetical protein